ncbi:MAG: metal-sensitive transcriptional regulator [Candidatus Moranbacteria bacterium]|nr:metal-sensitive transcriptional regulator [Candidatus Moranbacteria bacterium]
MNDVCRKEGRIGAGGRGANADRGSSSCVLRRLSRIEGQVRGIRKMIEEGRDCEAVVQQVSAVREAVSTLGLELLRDDFACRRRKGREIDERFLRTLFRMR